jgi:hypothetical protein
MATLDIKTVVTGVMLLLVASFVTAILSGRLVPRSTVLREQEILNSQLGDWKEACATSEKVRADVADQLRMLVTSSEATARVLSSLPHIKSAPEEA